MRLGDGRPLVLSPQKVFTYSCLAATEAASGRVCVWKDEQKTAGSLRGRAWARGSPEGRRVRGANPREAGCGTAPRFSFPNLAVIVWGLGAPLAAVLGPGSPPGNCSDRPSAGPPSPPPTAMIDILLRAPAYLLPAACRYRLQTPFPCLILILFD